MEEMERPGAERASADYGSTVSECTVRTGRPEPLGASRTAGGVNFALFGRHATRVSREETAARSLSGVDREDSVSRRAWRYGRADAELPRNRQLDLLQAGGRQALLQGFHRHGKYGAMPRRSPWPFMHRKRGAARVGAESWTLRSSHRPTRSLSGKPPVSWRRKRSS